MITTNPVRVLQFRAFTIPGDSASGNAAGVVLNADELTDAEMLHIAAELGHSETAFLSSVTSSSARVRYFTPRAEIAFCGHATIASGAVLARSGAEPLVMLTTNAGLVPVDVTPDRVALTAVEASVHTLDPGLVDELLAALRLERTDLDPDLPPAFVRGGNPHPLIPVVDGVLPRLQHDAEALLQLQDREGWDGTVPVVHRVTADRFVSRNPFPRGGILEDPATGSAAADLGEYLRHGGHLALPAEIVIMQGAETGHPSSLTVFVPVEGRIRVSGTAEPI